MTRGLSQAATKAANYARKNPDITAAELAKKFGLNQSTVYRSDWWKNRRTPAK
jgi:DNA-binding MurR/RpiR family transcriptional regulator